LREVPRLILQHNIHGVDIDPRATQIARLTLWLRAQRAWQEQGVEVAARPAVTRSNVVCAEPMPGEKELLADFVDQQFPEAERGLVQQLLEVIFDKMQLAGEAGSLLKIDEEIRDAIEQARREWQKLAIQQRDLFSAGELAALGGVGFSLSTDLQNLTKDFWIDIEERIYTALSNYAEKAQIANGLERRLFAEDAAQGFAFIDICKKRYDVALMNPPFGAATPTQEPWLAENYTSTRLDLAACFMESFLQRVIPGGMVGAITSRSIYFLSSFEDFRRTNLLGSSRVTEFADVGFGVLDAMVNTALCITENTASSLKHRVLSFGLHTSEDKDADLLASVDLTACKETLFVKAAEYFTSLPSASFSYWGSEQLVNLFSPANNIASASIDTCVGLQSDDDYRFLRLVWEIDSALIGREKEWVFVAKGGEYSKFWDDIHLVVNWARAGAAVKALVASLFGNASKHVQNERHYFRGGLTYPFRTNKGFNVRCLPQGCVFTLQGMAVLVPNDEKRELLYMLGLLNSHVTLYLLRMLTSSDAYQVGYVRRLPCKIEDDSIASEIRLLSLKATVPSRRFAHIAC
jgi:hypothetical protein